MCKFKLCLRSLLVWKIRKDNRILGTNAANPNDSSSVSTNEKKSTTMPILVSNQTPVNLLGRDALCKMGLHIWCSPDGVYIDTMGIETQMMVLELKANVYWIGQMGEE